MSFKQAFGGSTQEKKGEKRSKICFCCHMEEQRGEGKGKLYTCKRMLWGSNRKTGLQSSGLPRSSRDGPGLPQASNLQGAVPDPEVHLSLSSLCACDLYSACACLRGCGLVSAGKCKFGRTHLFPRIFGNSHCGAVSMGLGSPLEGAVPKTHTRDHCTSCLCYKFPQWAVALR